MEMTGSQLIPASQAETWRALNDPETLKACIPGCETIERVSDSEYRVTMTARVGPVAAKFRGKLLISDADPPRAYSLSFEGQGGAAGFGKGSAKVQLAPEGTGTRLSYTASAQVGGKLAQIGSRLVDAAAKKVANDFFAAFDARVGGVRIEEAPAAAPASPMWMRWLIGAILIAALVALVMLVG
jgi:carbon monoxide dehydrogenase subunit G